jgi:hypothetical protein
MGNTKTNIGRKRHHPSFACSNPNQQQPTKKQDHSDPNHPTFPSYLDTPNPLSLKIKLLCAIVAETRNISVKKKASTALVFE